MRLLLRYHVHTITGSYAHPCRNPVLEGTPHVDPRARVARPLCHKTGVWIGIRRSG
jgi:hypothetical protein